MHKRLFIFSAIFLLVACNLPAQRTLSPAPTQPAQSTQPPIPTTEGSTQLTDAQKSLLAQNGFLVIQSQAVIKQLAEGDFISIVDGPKQTGGRTWWKIRIEGTSQPVEGWVVEDQNWYERA